MSSTVDVDPALLKQLEEFRMAKRSSGSAAIIIKIDKRKLLMSVEESYDDTTLEELGDELPENSPRFIVLSYKLEHKDGRVSFPLVLVNWQPTTSPVDLSTLYASALSNFAVQADVGKVVDVRDGVEGFTKEFLDERLGAA
ncbi:glia maturation factor beta [Tilletiaria anomala UBC 951]|uniref:Glia maturation factor beta n=1 Tax=Tilletiaria anomala (strain ATCC 24038 / CBS 436.72 / UBC 951) TaxID=1037660 RepID=A0A066VGX7_TILAU|nr:glia maturation factor beta [Tilletiaria anomala UBC 951]KDN37815.1 glia maturation factor beta [Tilletiaria anomala UBC 951]